jgi:hypothetical protein
MDELCQNCTAPAKCSLLVMGLIGKCEMPVGGNKGFGQCPECEQLGCQGLACDCCDGTTFFERFDTDCVHLDVMEAKEKGEYDEFI